MQLIHNTTKMGNSHVLSEAEVQLGQNRDNYQVFSDLGCLLST